jgi:type IV pilus assembly protein PilW
MIELSVAILIALFLLGGVFMMQQSTKKTYTNQQALAQLQDNQRLAMSLIGDVVQSAGYFPDPRTQTPASTLTAVGLFAAPPTGSSVVAQSVAGPINASPDVLYVRYTTAPGDNIILCDGSTNNAAADQTYINKFFIYPNPSTGTNQLACTLGSGAVGTGGAVSNVTIPLVDNVQSLTVLYGVKKNAGTTDDNIDTYLTATQMAATDWYYVTSVKVTVSFTNPLYGQPGCTGTSTSYCNQQTIPFTRVIDLMYRAGVNTGDL